MRGRPKRLTQAFAMALAAALAALGAPLHAQEDAAPHAPAAPLPVPYDYADGDLPRPAPRNKLPRIIAREEAAAAAAERACDAGDQAGCTALARAYLYGAGKPQSRKAAEMLLREACAAGEGAACHEMGTLFVTLDKAEAVRFGLDTLKRGCDLGALDACEDYAAWIEAPTPGSPLPLAPDPAAATALREETCARGGAAACITLATAQIATYDDDARVAAGRARLDQLCNDGEARACAVLIGSFGADPDQGGVPGSGRRALLDRACRAGHASACAHLGRMIFAESAGPPEQRSAALALFQRACELSATQCEEERDITFAPQFDAACAAGNQAQCAALGEILGNPQSVLYQPAAAVRLLGRACDAAGIASACQSAADALLIGEARERQLADGELADARRWLLTACDTNLPSCDDLAVRLIRGDLLPVDRPQGYALLARACEAQHEFACETLADLAEEDPEAPLPVASSKVRPPMTEAEEEAYYAAISVEREAAKAQDRANDCNITTVTFRGQTFNESICDARQRVRGGFVARVGDAPWQAMIWRPAVIDGAPVGLRNRVACGGTLVANGWVLTAAHCLEDHYDPQNGKFNRIDRHPYRIRLGLLGLDEDEGDSYPIVRVIPHRNFVRKDLAFDIALIQYDPRARKPGRKPFRPETIAIDRRSVAEWPVVPGRPVYAYGWGVTDANSALAAERLQGVRLLLRGAQDCARVTKFTDPGRKDSVLCAAGPSNQQACFGDSGGPLVFDRGPKDPPLLVGVVSGGWKCGTTRKRLPSQYTRIGHREVQAFLAENLPGFRSGRPRP